MLRRVQNIHAAPEDSNGSTTGFNRAAVRRRVYAQRHAADDRNATSSQFPGKLPRHPHTVRRGAARADNCHAVLVLFPKFSSHEQGKRRVVDLREVQWIFGVLKGNKARAILAQRPLLDIHVDDVRILGDSFSELGPHHIA